jgi:sRNA-binding protein
VVAGGPRYALDGTVCGEVTKLQREAAKARLQAIAKATLRKAARAKLEAVSAPGVALPTPPTKPGRRSFQIQKPSSPSPSLMAVPMGAASRSEREGRCREPWNSGAEASVVPLSPARKGEDGVPPA